MNLVLCIRRGEAVSVVTYNTEVAIQSDRGDLPLCVCLPCPRSSYVSNTRLFSTHFVKYDLTNRQGVVTIDIEYKIVHLCHRYIQNSLRIGVH